MSARARADRRKKGGGGPEQPRKSRADFLEEQIHELLRDAEQARRTRQPGAAVAARGKAADLRLELDKLRAFERERRAKRTPLEQARAMRMRADAAGSHVAARDYFRLELELADKDEQRRIEEQRLRLAHMGLDERISRLAEVLLQLPDQVREQVRSAVFDPVH